MYVTDAGMTRAETELKWAKTLEHINDKLRSESSILADEIISIADKIMSMAEILWSDEIICEFIDFYYVKLQWIPSYSGGDDMVKNVFKREICSFLAKHNVVSASTRWAWAYISGYNKRNAEKVKEFTGGAFGAVADKPTEPLDRKRAEFIVGMVISEMAELLRTVTDEGEDVIEEIRKLCGKDANSSYVKPTDTTKLIAEQADAMVDAMYYMYDVGARTGINLDSIFDVVHKANMDKRDPATGKFIKREDGKILKPEGWKEPDIMQEVARQMAQGAWST
jgi:predicted HAD superfamily Cof-like phosphohydrolase